MGQWVSITEFLYTHCSVYDLVMLYNVNSISQCSMRSDEYAALLLREDLVGQWVS